jgi:hypothetical protein
VTPINDSFIDLDVLAHIKEETLDMSRPGVYSEVVWQAKLQRAKRDKGEVDWVVLRNRLSNLDAHNKRQMADALDKLSRKTGCRIAQGFSELVIYRELFLKGLTLLDLMEKGSGINLRMTHIAARQELRELIHFLDLRYRIEKKRAQAHAVLANSLTNKVIAESSNVEEKAELSQKSPQNNQDSSNRLPKERHHYSLEELAKIEAEIEAREGIVDSLEDLENMERRSLFELDEEEVTPEHNSNYFDQEMEPSFDQQEQAETQAEEKEEKEGLSDEVKQKLEVMLQQSKTMLETSEEPSEENTGKNE